MLNFFFIRTDNKYVKVNFHEINYVEACGNYVRIVTPNKSFIVLLSMKQMEKVLPCKLFCRVHRSYIVALNSITAFDHELVYLDNKHIPLSDFYKNRLQEKVIIVLSDVRNQPKVSNEPVTSLIDE